MEKGFKKVCAGAAVLALAGGAFAAGRLQRAEATPLRAEALGSSAAPSAATASAGCESRCQGLPSFAPVVQQAAPAVVHIKVVSVVKATEQEARPGLPDWFGKENPSGDQFPFHGFQFPGPPPSSRQRGEGSGFIIRKDGIVLTNNHVVANAKEITVVLSDGREFSAKLVGRDPKTDLAVLKIQPKGDLPAVQLGDSDTLNVGDWVVAIGNPFGLSNTVTAGIVSAKGRAIDTSYDRFIQIDAPINPGNSGGPLFDEQGRVVGINTAIFSQSGGNIGIGFAIPINLAKQLVPELETTGHVNRAWLGVSIQKLTPELAESLGVESKHGALVAEVMPESPAADAGIKTGDVITRYDGKAVDEHDALPMMVASTPVGKTVPVGIWRDGKALTIDVTVAKLANDVAEGETAPARGKWGLALRELTPEERGEMHLAPNQGVMVAGVEPDSPAAEADIHQGDVILEVGRQTVGSVEALRKAVGKVPAGKPLLLLVRPADGNTRFAALAAR
jgi:serine protease Do